MNLDDINSRGNGMFKTDGRFFTQIGYGSDSSKRFAWSGTLAAEQEELDGTWTYSSDLGFTYTPTDNLTFELDVTYKNGTAGCFIAQDAISRHTRPTISSQDCR